MVQKMEFSKKILIAVTVIVAAITIYACVLMWRVGDLSPLAYLIPSAFAELATATGFYYAKAKRENEIKLRKKYGQQVYQDTKEAVYG